MVPHLQLKNACYLFLILINNNCLRNCLWHAIQGRDMPTIIILKYNLPLFPHELSSIDAESASTAKWVKPEFQKAFRTQNIYPRLEYNYPGK